MNDTNVERSSVVATTAAAVLLGLLSVLIVLGNVLVVYVYANNKKLQVPKNYLIVSLAVTDILIGTIPLNLRIVYLVQIDWKFGQTVCNVWLVFDYALAQVGTLTLLSIALERFISIKYAIFYRRHVTRRNGNMLVVGTWLFSFVLWATAILLYGSHGDQAECYAARPYESMFATIATTFFLFYGPFVIMCISYTHLSIILYRRYKNVIAKKPIVLSLKYQLEEKSGSSSLEPPNENNITEKEDSKKGLNENGLNAEILPDHDVSSSNFSENNTPDKFTEVPGKLKRTVKHGCFLKIKFKKRSTRTQRQYVVHKKAVTLLLLVTLAFTVTCLPYNLISIIVLFCPSCYSHAWLKFGVSLYYVNSLLNPLCYGFGNKRFKNAFRKLFHEWKIKITSVFTQHEI